MAQNNPEHDPALLYRLRDIIGTRRKGKPPTVGMLPIAPSTWWELVAAGEVPKPMKIGTASYWLASDIHALVERLAREGSIATRRRARKSDTSIAKAAGGGA